MADPDELDRLSLLMSPKFQQFLSEARDDIQQRRLIPEEKFWKQVEADAKTRTAKPARKRTKPKVRS